MRHATRVLHFLLGIAYAATLPGVCPPGLHLAEDGACTGGQAPWRAPGEMFRVAVADDGRVVVVADLMDDTTIADGDVAVVDPVTGASVVAGPPFPGARGFPFVPGDPLRVLGPFGQGQDDPASTIRQFDPATGAWRDLNPPPGPLMGATTARHGDVVLVVGGYRDDEGRRTTWRYTPATDEWTPGPNLLTGRIAPVVTVDKKGPVVCGGFDRKPDGDTIPLRSCERLEGRRWKEFEGGFPGGAEGATFPLGERVVVLLGDQLWEVAGGRWRSLGGVPDGTWPRSARRMGDGELWLTGPDGRWFVLDGDAWALREGPAPDGVDVRLADGWAVLRGDDPPARAYDDASALDLDVGLFPTLATLPGGGLAAVDTRGGWRVDANGEASGVPALPEPRHGGALIPLDDGGLVSFGGTDKNMRPLGSAWRWAPGDAGWKTLPDPPAIVKAPVLERVASARVGAHAWAFGADGPVAAVHLDVGAWTWSEATLPFTVIEAVAIGERILLVSRPEGAPGTWVQRVAWLSPATGELVEVAPLPTPRESPAVVVEPSGNVLVLGGHGPEDGPGVDAVHRLDVATGTWRALAPLRDERDNPDAVALSDHRVLVLGGDRGRVEIYDPLVGVSFAAAPMLRPWGEVVASPLADGRVVLAGSSSVGAANRDVAYEIYAPGQPWRGPALPTPPGMTEFVLLRAYDAARAACLAGDDPSCAKADRMEKSFAPPQPSPSKP